MIEEIKKILIGIDQTELENPEGWWETSAGAEFGANKLKQIAEALGQPVSSHGNAEDLYLEMSKHLNCPHCGGSGHIDDVAQPEQEPVAWSYWQSCLNDDGTQTAPWVHRLSKFKPDESIINKDVTPLYTTPPQRKPLSDEEIILIVAECASSHQHTDIHFARAIERAHGIKGLV